MKKIKRTISLIWGCILITIGICVFFKINHIIPEFQKNNYYFGSVSYIKFAFYLIGVILIGGGIKKIYNYYKKK